ncbi:hypothetical protein QF043_003021 [Pseudomonas sp. W3I7]|nr:hypothetical protein [Pseudomonas sp. W3I7]
MYLLPAHLAQTAAQPAVGHVGIQARVPEHGHGQAHGATRRHAGPGRGVCLVVHAAPPSVAFGLHVTFAAALALIITAGTFAWGRNRATICPQNTR